MPNYWVFSDKGMKQVMEALRNAGLSNYLNTLTLRLYKNDATPAHGDANGVLETADFTGYLDQATTNWGAAVTNGAAPNADVTDLTHTFTATGGAIANTIYGVLLIDGVGDWIAAQRTNLGVPATIDAAGKSYQFQPRLTGAIYSNYP